jgi:PAS domain S-box-containing protein
MNSPINILYLDESPFDRDMIRDSLEKEHGVFILTEASSRKEFEKLLSAGTVNIVLSDFNILGFEGLQVIETVHTVNAGIPVIIVTGTGSEEVAVESMKRGAADYVVKKPKHIQRLPAIIHAVLEKCRCENEVGLRHVFEMMSQGVVVQDKNGIITLVNPAAETILGLTFDDLRRKNSMDSSWKSIKEDGTPFPGESHPSMVSLRTGKPVLNVTMGVFNPRLNEYRWINIDAFPQCAANDPFAYQVYTVFEDITDRKRADDKLNDAVLFNQMIFKTSPVGILIFKESGQCIMANSAAVAISGGTKDQLLRRNFREDESYNALKMLDAADEALQSGKIVRKEFHGVSTYGKDVWFDGLFSSFQLEGERHLLFMVYDIKDQKNTEQELRNSEKRLRDILDNLQDAYFRADADGRFTIVNPAAARMYGYETADEMIGLPAHALYADQHERQSVIDEIRQHGSVHDRIGLGRKKDGSTIWVSLNTQLFRGDKGEILGTEAIVRDITERKLADSQKEAALEELKRQKHFFEQMFMQSSVSMQILDKDGWCEKINPKHSKLFGVKPEHIEGKVYNIFKDEGIIQGGIIPHLNTVFKEGKSAEWEVLFDIGIASKSQNIPVAEKKNVWYQNWSYPIFDEQGQLSHVIIQHADITENKQAEDALKHEQSLLQALMDNIPDHIYFKDLSSRFLRMNKALADHFSLNNPAQAIGKTDFDFFTAEHAQAAFDGEQKIIRSGRAIINIEEKETWADGHESWVSTTKVPLRDQNGRITGTVGISRDITERKGSEEQLIQSEKEYKYLFQNAHDAILLLDPEGKIILEANDRALDLYGFTRDEFIGMSLRKLSKYPDKGNEKISQVLRGQHIGNYETVQFRKDGSELILEISGSMVQHNGKQVILSMNHDITERKRIEDVREGERVLMKTLIDNLPSSVFIKDRNYKKTVVNSQHLRRMTATLRRPVPLSERDVLEKTDFDVYPKELAEVYIEEDRRVIEDGETIINRELCSYDSGGQPVWELISKIPLRDTSGGVIGMVGIANDITERKRFEEELQINETRYRLISNVVSDYVFSTKIEANGTLKAEWVAGAFEAMTGYTFEEYKSIGGWRAIVHPDDRTIDERDLEQLRSNQQIETELRTIMKNGSIMWVRVYAHPVWDAQRNILIGIYGAVQNISGHKQAEKTLRESEERFRSLYENSTVGIYRSTPDGKFLLANPALLTMLGYSSFEELAQRDLKKEGFEHSYDRTRFIEHIEKTGDVKGLESCWTRKDGTKVFLRENSRAIRDFEGKTLYYDGIVEDVTEQKRTEESLMRLNQAVAASGEVIFMTDRSGIITFMNAAFTRLYGYEPSDVIGKATPRVLKSGMQQRDHYTVFWRTLLNRQIVKSEWINRTKDGRLLNVEVTANPILDSQGKIIGFLCIQRDITQQRNLEKEIHQAQKLESLGTLASGIAHDFNNILGIIMGHSTMISIARSDPQRLKASIDAINKASERGASLVRQMLTFARKSDIDFTPLQINDSIKEIEKLYHETFPKTMTLQCQLTEQLPLIIADSTQLHQVLLNLCVNARDAMNGNGTITITTGVTPGETLRTRFHDASYERYVCIEVQDTGIGMDEATRQRIFDPFFTTKEIGKGTGLGLAVVFGIMESHEGFIEVQSEIGHGTTFFLYFPIKNTRSKSSYQEKDLPDTAPHGTETLLVVEDEELLRELLQISLEGSGYRILTATNGEEAVEVYKQHQHDISLVLSDLGLPIFNGREILKKLMEINPAVRFIIATGYTDPGEKSDIFKEGAKEIVQKPYEMNVLLKKIRDVLDA